MKSSTKRVLLVGIGALVLLPVAAFVASPDVREEVRSFSACSRLVGKGFRPLATERQNRFLGKVKDYTMLCRGGNGALVSRQTPWVDWSNYWGAGDNSSRSNRGLLTGHLARNGRGVDGALLDLEYQRLDLLRFNLFDNYTFKQYVDGVGKIPGRSIKVWPEMRLPPDNPNYTAVGGTGTQLCKGELIRHRTLEGICNDIKNPLMGSTNTVFARNVQFEETFPLLGATQLVRNRHGDRLALLRPDPQVISRELFTRQQSDSARCNNGQGAGDASHCDYIKAPFFNVLAAFWIQFMTHDWFSHMDEGHNDKAMMAVGCQPEKGSGKDSSSLTPAQIAALRCRPDDRVDRALMAETSKPSTFTGRDGKTYLTRAQQTSPNTNTAWWDASQLYGYSERSGLRVKRDPRDRAKMHMELVGSRTGTGERQGYLPVFSATDPIHPAWQGQEATAFPDNWSIGLSFYHNVFAREHNLFVDEFRKRAAANPNGDSGLLDPANPTSVIRYADVNAEQIFQLARLVVAAEIAKIHTIEWTTQLLYDEPLYTGMNANWFGLIRNDNPVTRSLDKIAVHWLGKSFDEKDQTTWYSVFASGAGIFGLGSHRYAGRIGFRGYDPAAKDLWNVGNADDVNGGVNHFGSPFNFPEEFITVYRLHPLVPDLLDFRNISAPNKIQREVPVVSTFRGLATPAMRDGGLANWALTMGRQRLAALTLQNHPMFIQNLPMPRLGTKSGKLDIAALDIIRDREHGIPRFNEFRRQYGLKSLSGFDDFIDVRLPANSPESRRQQAYVAKLRQIYGQHRCDDSKSITAAQELDGRMVSDCLGHPDGSMVDNVEDLDVVVGWLAEATRPHGFAISETQFTVFILNASRRLFGDRFFTSSFRPEFYSTLGVEWVTNNGPTGPQEAPGLSNGHRDEVSPLKRVLLRTMPELAAELKGVVNAFDPWARDRGEYYSLQWKPRAGAEDDPAFRSP
ncbi:MAG: peroxidase family protein [Gemmatimonadales bacterium]